MKTILPGRAGVLWSVLTLLFRLPSLTIASVAAVSAAIVFAAGGLVVTTAAAAEDRVALVIGNDAYRTVPALRKAVNDARAVAARLRSIGFTVIAHENLDRRGVNAALNEFEERLNGAEVGLFYYAGHGVQVDGNNILLPVDIPAPRSANDILDEGIELARILERMAATNVRFASLVIDACRDNPFPRRGTRSLGATRGLTLPAAPNGVYIVYSAGVNEQALDDLGPNDRNPNSVFARNLLPLLTRPGLSFDRIVKETREGVRRQAASIRHQQNPAIYDQTTGDFYFVPSEAAAVATARPAPFQDARPQAEPANRELLLWDSIKDGSDVAAFQGYLQQYPRGTFAEQARFRIAGLAQPVPATGRTSVTRDAERAPSTYSAPPQTAALPPASAQPAPVDRDRLISAIQTYYAGQKVYEDGRLARSIELVRAMEIVSATDTEIEVRLQYDAEPLFPGNQWGWNRLRGNRSFLVRRDGENYQVTAMR